MKNPMTEILEPFNDLLTMKVPLTKDYFPHVGLSGDDGFSPHPLKDEIAKIFNEDREYVFLRTVGNREADVLIRENQKKLRGSKDTEYFYHFSASLHDAYLRAIDEQCKKLIIPVVSYPLVNSDCHSLDRHREHAFWPTIHIVGNVPKSSVNVNIFTRAVQSLNSDEIYDSIKEHEAPQNYRMAEINLLRKHKVNPLLIEMRLWKVSSENLRNALDFLLPFTYSNGKSDDNFYSDD